MEEHELQKKFIVKNINKVGQYAIEKGLLPDDPKLEIGYIEEHREDYQRFKELNMPKPTKTFECPSCQTSNLHYFLRSFTKGVREPFDRYYCSNPSCLCKSDFNKEGKQI